MTNAEYLRSLSDEELIRYVMHGCLLWGDCDKAPKTEFGSAICSKCALNWLREEHKDD